MSLSCLCFLHLPCRASGLRDGKPSVAPAEDPPFRSPGPITYNKHTVKVDHSREITEVSRKQTKRRSDSENWRRSRHTATALTGVAALSHRLVWSSYTRGTATAASSSKSRLLPQQLQTSTLAACQSCLFTSRLFPQHPPPPLNFIFSAPSASAAVAAFSPWSSSSLHNSNCTALLDLDCDSFLAWSHLLFRWHC